MLTVAKLTAEQGGYYETSVAASREDYYAGRGEARGVLMGRAADLAGLSGELADGELGELLEMRNPRPSEAQPRQLRHVQAARQVELTEADPATGALVKRQRALAPVAGYDMTFGVPKSLSVLVETADPLTDEGSHIVEAVSDAHEAAVAAALDYLEHHTCRYRTGKGGVERHQGAGFIAAAYKHRTSRAQDPHLHTHVLVANATIGADGKWRALDGQAILGGRGGHTGDHRHAASDLYDATLRAEMAARGFRFGALRQGGFAEVAEVPQAVVDEFSTRRRQVVEAMAESGQAGYYGSRAAALMTRARKVTGTMELTDTREGWRARAAEHGMSADEIAQIGARALNRMREGVGVEGPDVGHLVDDLVSEHGLTETANTFNAARARQAICQAHQQGITPAQVEALLARLLSDERVVEVGEGVYTATSLIAAEERILTDAERVAGARAGVVDERVVEAVLDARAGRGLMLTAEQKGVVDAVTSSGRGVEVIEAWAGTGKTHTLGALAEVYEAAGYEVIGATPTGRAARELGDVGVQARTLQSLAGRLERRGGFERGSRIVVLNDEASMNGTRVWAQLLEQARVEGVSVKWIAVGDSGQLQSVAAGGAFGEVAQRQTSVRLTEVHRQRDRDHRAALGAIRAGRPAEWVEWKTQRGELHAGGLDEMASAAVGEWARAQQAEEWGQVALIARENGLRGELNQRARSEALERGWIGRTRDGDTAPILVIGEGDHQRQFTTGDRVIARRNDRALGTDNGTRGTVLAADPVARMLTVEADDGRRVIYTPDYLDRGLVEHAYALTGHTSQGATLERAPVIGRPAEFSAEWGYVAHSRERDSSPTFLITDAKPDASRDEAGGPHRHEPTRDETLTAYTRALGQSDAGQLASAATATDAMPTIQRPDVEQAARESLARIRRLDADRDQTTKISQRPKLGF